MVPVQLRELDRLVMAGAAAAVLPDSCVLLRYQEGPEDSHGFPMWLWVADETPTSCALTPSGGKREKDDQASETLLAQGRVRFAVDVALDHRDRLLLLSRFGQVLTTPPHARTYELTEEALVTAAGLHTDCPVLGSQDTSGLHRRQASLNHCATAGATCSASGSSPATRDN